MLFVMSIKQLESEAHLYFNQGNVKLAIETHNKILTLDPNNLASLTNLSYLYFHSQHYDLALLISNRAILLYPDNVDILLNHANALRECGELDRSIVCLEKATRLNPNFAAAWNGLSLGYIDKGRASDAISSAEKSIKSDSNFIHAYSNLAIILQLIGETSRADRLFQRALLIDKSELLLHHNYLMNQQYLPNLSSLQLKSSAIEYGDEVIKRSGQSAKYSKRLPDLNNRQINIGFISADFRCHPVGFFFQSVIASFDSSKIKSFLYLNQQIDDDLTKELTQSADNSLNILKMTDQEVITRISDDNIHILFDLSGHSAGNRLSIFAKKAAPIQVSWLGYFASTGLPTIDFVFLGENQINTASQSYFSENIYLLKGTQFCYQPPSYAPKPSSPPCLQNNYITFGSFNNLAKLNCDVIELWSKILLQVPNSRLLLKWKVFADVNIQNKVISLFALNGIENHRIELRSASAHKDMLDEYADIDIALDPFPFSGALTTCEALWMGVPVITYAQERPVSRQTLGILAAIDMNNFSAKTPKQYLELACHLSHNTNKIIELRQSLRTKMEKSELMDGKAMANKIEKACMDIYMQAHYKNN